MYEILWWKQAAVLGDKCIWNQTQSCPTTNQKWYKLPKRQSTKQQHTQDPSCLQARACQVQKDDTVALKEGTRYTTWAQEVPALLLCKSGEYNNRSQTASSNFQERCNNAISENTMNFPQNTPVESKNHIQTWTRSIDSRLTLKTKPQRKQRQRNTWHAGECWCHTDNHKHPRLHVITAITRGNLTEWLPKTAQRLYHQRLAREQRWNTTRHANILNILKWYGSCWWCYTERRVHSNTQFNKNRHQNNSI